MTFEAPAFLPGDLVTVADGLYEGVQGRVDQLENGIVVIEVTDAPHGLLPRVPAGDKYFLHVEPWELCA